MTKAKDIAPIASAKAGDAVRVRDAKTREIISHVIAADAERGKVTRYATEGGNLVREGDSLKVVKEDRDIVIERVDPVTVDPLDVSAIDATKAAS